MASLLWGVVAASASGTLFSGIAYVAWCHVVRKLNDDFESGVIQLSVPIFVTLTCFALNIGAPPPARFQYVCGGVALVGATLFFWFSPKNKLRQLLKRHRKD